MKGSEAELPPQYSSATLSTSSHGVTLRIPSTSYRPGDDVPIYVSATRAAVDSIVGEAQCSLKGKSSVVLMGKTRYQVGQIANAGMGGGGAYPVTAREEHTFAATHVTVDLARTEKSDPDELFRSSLAVPTERTCNCPGSKADGIMPTIPEAEDVTIERSSVRWTVTVAIKRKGLLKRDVKLSLQIPVSLPPLPPIDTVITQAGSAPTTFGGAQPPNLKLDVAVFPPSPDRPLSIPFRIHVSSTPPPSMLSRSDIFPAGKLRVTFALSRHMWTQGIDQAKFGEPGGFHWPGSRVRTVNPGLNESAKGDGLVFEGSYDLEEGEKSVQGCALVIRWIAHAQVMWDHLSSPLVLDMPMFLPPALAR